MEYKMLSTILVTTEEALENCLKEPPTVFCIEEPLYSQLCASAASDPRLQDYDIRVHPSDRYILLLRSAAPNPFDPSKYRFLYHPVPCSRK